MSPSLYPALLLASMGLATAAADTLTGCYQTDNLWKSMPNIIQRYEGTLQSPPSCDAWCSAMTGILGPDFLNTVRIIQNDLCGCRENIPHESGKVDDEKCDQPCPGDEDEFCGSKDGEFVTVSFDSDENPDTDEVAESHSHDDDIPDDHSHDEEEEDHSHDDDIPDDHSHDDDEEDDHSHDDDIPDDHTHDDVKDDHSHDDDEEDDHSHDDDIPDDHTHTTYAVPAATVVCQAGAKLQSAIDDGLLGDGLAIDQTEKTPAQDTGFAELLAKHEEVCEAEADKDSGAVRLAAGLWGAMVLVGLAIL